MEWAQFPCRQQAQSCGVAPEATAWRVCGPGLWGQKSENTNSASVWGEGMAGLTYRNSGELLGIRKKGECEAVAQVFVLLYCVKDCRGT